MRLYQALIIAAIALLFPKVIAQEIKIESFTIIENGVTTDTTQFGGPLALVIVKLNLKNAKFQGQFVKKEERPSEYLIYLVPGAKNLKIYAEGYDPCEVSFSDWEIEKVEPKAMYNLVLKPETIAPKTQQVQINVTPSNAMVYLDDEPLTTSDGIAEKILPFGTYKYRVEAEGYETQTGNISNYDVDKPTVVNIILKKKKELPPIQPTGILRVEYNPANSEVWIDGMNRGTTPIVFRDLRYGNHKVEIKKDGYEPKTEYVAINMGDSALLSGKLIPIPSNKSSFYLEAKFQAGMMMGVGASVGAYISNFNIEGTFLLGLAESEEIAWINKKQTTNSGYTYTYKPMFYGIKLGYGITCSKSFRITPQVGVGVSSITGSQVKAGSGTNPDATSCYAVPASVGARFEYYFTEKFGLSASPEFGFSVMKSDTYTKLSDLSSKVKGFGSGFNARVGIFVSF